VSLLFDEYDRIVPSNRVISEDEEEVVVAEEVVEVQKKGTKRKRGESLKGRNIYIIIIIFLCIHIYFFRKTKSTTL
jgi:hypothetical protein